MEGGREEASVLLHRDRTGGNSQIYKARWQAGIGGIGGIGGNSQMYEWQWFGYGLDHRVR